MNFDALKITLPTEADELETISAEYVAELSERIGREGATAADYWEALRLLNRAGICARTAQEYRREKEGQDDLAP